MKSILREKYRYILFEIIVEEEFGLDGLDSGIKKFENALRESLIKLVGEIDLSYITPRMMVLDEKKEFGIVRVLREGEKEARIAFSLITEMNGIKIHLKPLFVSGTIKKCKTKMQNKMQDRQSKMQSKIQSKMQNGQSKA